METLLFLLVILAVIAVAIYLPPKSLSERMAPTLTAAGDTPLAEAILAAVAETERHAELLRRAAEVEILTPHYFLFSDGKPTSRPELLAQAAAMIRACESARRGAFYGFGTDDAAIHDLQPLFVRQVEPLGDANFADLFHVISVSVRMVSSRSASEDLDLTSLIRMQLRIPYGGSDDA